MKIAALIPAYNEEKTIAAVLREVRPFAAEIVVVDDGSTDGTAAAVRESGATVLRHETNRGKGAALRTGFHYLAGGGFDAVLTMDSDLQHKADEAVHLIETMGERGADLVIGERTGLARHTRFLRRFGNLCTNFWVGVVAGLDLPDTQSGFRLLSKRFLSVVRLESDGYEIETEMILKAARLGLTIASVPIEVNYMDGTATSKMRALPATARVIKVLVHHLWSAGTK